MSHAPAVSPAPDAWLRTTVRDVPWAAARSGLRVARTTAYLLHTLGDLRRSYPRPGPERPSNLATRTRTMQEIARRVCSLHGVKVEVRGPIPSQPCLLVANHLGYLDPIAIGSVTPSVAIAKREVAGWPIFGESLERLGCLFVKRGCAHSGAVVLRRARRSLARGVSVLTFPEGTTTWGDDVRPLHRGVFGLAQRDGYPVVPIAILHRPRESAWVDDQLFLSHYLRTTARATTRVALAFGAPLPAEAAERPEALAALARARLRALLHDLRGNP